MKKNNRIIIMVVSVSLLFSLIMSFSSVATLAASEQPDCDKERNRKEIRECEPEGECIRVRVREYDCIEDCECDQDCVRERLRLRIRNCINEDWDCDRDRIRERIRICDLPM